MFNRKYLHSLFCFTGRMSFTTREKAHSRPTSLDVSRKCTLGSFFLDKHPPSPPAESGHREARCGEREETRGPVEIKVENGFLLLP